MKFTLGDCVKILILAGLIFILFHGPLLFFAKGEDAGRSPVSFWKVVMALLCAYLLVSIQKLYARLMRLQKRIDAVMNSREEETDTEA